MARKTDSDVIIDSADKELLDNLARRIKELRAAAGLSQRGFAKEAGLTQSYIYMLESGGPNVSLAVIRRIASVLGVPISVLFEGKESEGVSGPLLKGVEDELKKLSKLLEERRLRDDEILTEIERRLAEHAELVGALLRGKRQSKND